MGSDGVNLKVMIVDDHAVFRRGLREVLNEADGLEVVAEASNTEEAVERASLARPDIILMDIEMKGENGIDATRQISQLLPDTQIVMLTVSAADRHLFDAIKAGAVGYLTKDISPEALIKTIKGTRDGELPMSRRMASRMLAFFQQSASVVEEAERQSSTLTAREEEILELVATGARDKDIAKKLVISEATAKKHVQNILRKLHVRNRAQAAALSRQRPTSEHS